MTRTAFVWLLLLALIAAGSFFAGRAIRGGGSTASAFDLAATAYQPAASPAGFTRGGFSGFAETGSLEGSVVLAGKVAAIGPDSITVGTPAGPSTVHVTSDLRLRRVTAADRSALTAGVSVVALLSSGSGPASGVLIVLSP